ncbi:hypothetical protein ADUPG1_003683, partial [Aduncisulcus paluster]
MVYVLAQQQFGQQACPGIAPCTYLGRTIRRTYSSPGLCSSISVTSSPMRSQFSSIPSGSMISSSLRRKSGNAR